MRTVLAAACALAIAAGCLGEVADPQGPDGAGPGEAAFGLDALVADHDHQDPSLHNASYGLVLEFHDPLAGGPERASGAHTVDVKAGRLFVGAYGSQVDATGGAHIYDLADPGNPVRLGQYVAPGSLGGDRSIEPTDDGRFLLFGTENVDCAGHYNPTPAGLFLVDVQDPANPTVADFRPGAVHSVATTEIEGVHYVWTMARHQVPTPVPSPVPISVPVRPENVFRIDTTGPTARLVPVGTMVIAHDMTVFHDPILGRPLLLVANGAGPLVIYDVGEPARPVELATWEPAGRGDPPKSKWYVHRAVADIIDGRRILVVESEDWGEEPSPFWIVDFTDLAAPRHLSTWVNPAGLAASGLRWSQHNPYFEDGRLALSHYHAGVWYFDLSDPASWARPQASAYYLPHEDVGFRPGPAYTNKAVRDQHCGRYGEFFMEDAPLTFDVEIHDGLVFVADTASGLYVLRPTV